MPHETLEIKLRLHCLPVLPSGLTWCRTDPARPVLDRNVTNFEMKLYKPILLVDLILNFH